MPAVAEVRGASTHHRGPARWNVGCQEVVTMEATELQWMPNVASMQNYYTCTYMNTCSGVSLHVDVHIHMDVHCYIWYHYKETWQKQSIKLDTASFASSVHFL